MAGPLRILVVDDESDFLETVGFWLTSQGYQISQATSGQEALRVIETGKPDVVCLDFRMPQMDGVETLRRIRTFNKRLPVILITTVPESENTFAGAKALGIVGCFQKGSRFEQLGELLEAAKRMTYVPTSTPFTNVKDGRSTWLTRLLKFSHRILRSLLPSRRT